MSDWKQAAEELLGVELSPHSQGEAAGPCPECGGKDRFLVFEEGNYWCRQCGFKGWWKGRPTEEEREAKVRMQNDARDAALALMLVEGPRDYIRYHNRLREEPWLMSLWANEELSEEAVDRWGLGWCDACPLAPEYPSLTIPVFFRGQVVDIRHRLQGVPPERALVVGKYRSHRAHILPYPFHIEALSYGDVIIVEGEKKVILLHESGIKNVVGLPGVASYSTFLSSLAESDKAHHRRFTIAFDPGADNAARQLAKRIQTNHPASIVKIADFALKPDDFLLRYGSELTQAVLTQARTL